MNRAVVGLQWGDEAKGKVVDYLSRTVDIVVRYQGGPNAGHTVKIKDAEVIFHHLPSGLFHKEVKGLIGMGCLVDTDVLIEEIAEVKKNGIEIGDRLLISGNAHIILPYHKVIDKLREEKMNKIGTTRKGIGPAYEDKYGRTGIMMKDLLDEKTFFSKLKKILPLKNFLIMEMYKGDPVTEDEIKEIYHRAYANLSKFIGNTVNSIYDANIKGRDLIFEGAQGTYLDIGVGTYPYVTSSHPVSSGIGIGTGIFVNLDIVTGVMKAYTTRVGEGPLPTEMKDENADIVREKGHEYGATTGRPRRCGWLDLPMLKFAVKANRVNEVALTKIDVLDGLEKIRVCKEYRWKGKNYSEFNPEIMNMDEVEPQYIELEGWKSTIHGIKGYNNLPIQTRNYIDFIEKELNVPVKYISTGPEREEIIIK